MSFSMELYKILHYYIMPPFLILTTPLLVLYLACIGHDKQFSLHFILDNIIGNTTSLKMTLVVFMWAVIWLKLPSSKTYGPASYQNMRPEYTDNGFMYYVATMILFLLLQIYNPQLCDTIFWNMPALIGTLNITAFIFCVYIYQKGVTTPTSPSKATGLPTPYLFYIGTELHPRVFGVNVKQLTNCRFGLLLWQVLVLAFYITGYQRIGYNAGSLLNCILQTVYLAKFYWWEAGYFWTLDMTLDSAGYYLCWGCVAFVPMFFTYSTYYFVLHPPIISNFTAGIWLIIGLVSIGMEYRVDYEKQQFQKCHNSKDFKLWNKKVEYIQASYTDPEGNVRKSKLLVSGCWGVARHLNYFFELLLALSWSMAGYGLGVHTYLYLIFMFVLLVHRCFRDEKKCREKYGAAYDEYCKRTVYLAKFYWWEAGYFWTLDMTLDSAGYYICWGCMVLVPMFYTYSTYYLVLHPPIISTFTAGIWFIIGFLSLGMNFRVDYEKQQFQKFHNSKDFKLWNKKVEYIQASYTDPEGNVRKSKLLVSGCWGVARHLNYFFELLLALSWSMAGYGLGVHTYLYLIFMFVLLVHRCFRDEKKCREKYGAAYDNYCKRVTSRMIPCVF